jgi:hypothetical protein
MGIFWLFATGTLAVMMFLDPNGRYINRNFAPLMLAFGVLMIGWNAVRWWAARAAAKARAAQRPPERRSVEPREYHPEFDFNRPEEPKGNNGAPARGSKNEPEA